MAEFDELTDFYALIDNVAVASPTSIAADDLGDPTFIDTDTDGIIDTIKVDETGDGVCDVALVDSDQDGVTDTVLTNANSEGVWTEWSVDTDEDGELDTYYLYDSDTRSWVEGDPADCDGCVGEPGT